MKKLFKNKILPVALALGMSVSAFGCGIVVTTEGENQSQGVSTTQDASATKDSNASQGTDGATESNNKTNIPRLEDDYYAYVNKETMLSYDITSMDRQVGSDVKVQEEVEEEMKMLLGMIAENGTDFPEGSSELAIYKAYLQCEKFSEDKKSSADEAFSEVTKMISEINDKEDALAAMKVLSEQYGIVPVFDCEVAYNHFNGEDYMLDIDMKTDVFENELRDIYKSDSARKQFRNYVTDILVAAGETPDVAKEKATDFTYFIIDVAFSTDYEKENSNNPFVDFDFMTEAELNTLFKNIKIEDVENVCGISNPYGGWYVRDVKQLENLEKIFDSENIEKLKIYLLCEFATRYKFFLAPYHREMEAYASASSIGTDEIVKTFMTRYMSMQMSEVYAKYCYTEEMDKVLQRIYQDIKTSYKELIENADWLTRGTRDQLLRKLENMQFVYGSGNVSVATEDNKKIIGDDIFKTAVNANIYRIDQQKSTVGKKIDKTKSIMSSHIVNSAYDPVNTFTITVGIMHGDYFNVNAPYETNLGGIGMVMAHEMGHAFDSNCICYDENGAYLPEKIPEEDIQELNRRLTLIEDYYSGFSIMDIYYVDGVKTSGENYADLGAMECISNIVKDKAGREKAFENYAKIWCGVRVDTDMIEDLSLDVHSPAMIRVNAVLKTLDAFYETYDIKPGDGMYVAPEERVTRW